MKTKIFSLTLALILTLTLAACNKPSDSDDGAEDRTAYLRALEILVLSDAFIVSPFYNEGAADPVSIEYFNLLQEREAEFMNLADEIYSSTSLLLGQYETLGKAAQEHDATVGENIIGVLAEMSSYAEMREQTLAASKTTGQDPFITSSLQYTSAIYSVYRAQTFTDNMILLMAQCLYLNETHGDVLGTAISKANESSDALFELMGKNSAATAFLADLQWANMSFSHYMLTESVTDSEQALTMLRENQGDQFLIETLEESIRLDRAAIAILDDALTAYPAEAYQDTVLATPISAGSVYRGEISIMTLSYQSGEGITATPLSSGGGFVGRIKKALPAIWNGTVDTLKETFSDSVAIAGKVLSEVTETAVSATAFMGETAATAVWVVTGEADLAWFKKQMSENISNYTTRISQGDSGINAVTDVRTFIKSLDPSDPAWKYDDYVSPGVASVWAPMYAKLRDAGLSTVEDVLTMVDKNATQAEKEKVVADYLTGQIIDRALKIDLLSKIKEVKDDFDAINDKLSIIQMQADVMRQQMERMGDESRTRADAVIASSRGKAEEASRQITSRPPAAPTPNETPAVPPSDPTPDPSPVGAGLDGKFKENQYGISFTFSGDKVEIDYFGYILKGTYETNDGFMTFDFPGESVGYGTFANGAAYSLDGDVFTFDGEKYIREGGSDNSVGNTGNAGSVSQPVKITEYADLDGTFTRDDGVSLIFAGDETVTLDINGRIITGTYVIYDYGDISDIAFRLSETVGMAVLSNTGGAALDGDDLIFNREKFTKQ